jgi:LPS export ABC transporter permease LptF/LPS export ABC transporter permease LptG
MRILDRYVFRETLGPIFLGLAVYTFIMLVRFLFVSAEMIIERGVAAPVVGRMVLATLPNIMVLTLPMSLLFGLLTAVGRLSSDGELVAIRSSGVSLLSLYRPILLLSLALALANTAVSLYGVPWGNSELQRIRLEISSQSIARQVQPRIFYDNFEDKVLYIFNVDRNTQEWLGLFLADALPTSDGEVTLAERGRVKIAEDGERVILELENAEKHVVNLASPQRYQRHFYERIDFVLDESFTSKQKARISANRGLRELKLTELQRKLETEDLPTEQQNLTRVEIHKKLAIPAACLVFGLFALPLGFNNRRGGRSSGFAISMAVILGYYVMLNNGEEAARFGRMAPWLAMWLPNLVLATLGIVLLWRRNRDRDLLPALVGRPFQGLTGLLPTIQRRTGPRPGPGGTPAGSDPRSAGRTGGKGTVGTPTNRPRFPNTLDRYTLRVFLGVMGLVTVSILSLFIVADVSQLIDEILKNKIPRSLVAQYYFFRSFQMLYETAPIIVLVATLITFAVLSRANEVTAAKALGISLYRLSLPTVLVSALVALFCASLQFEILPSTNEQAQALEKIIRGKERNQQVRKADRWLVAKDGRFYHFLHFDPKQQALQRLQIFELANEHSLKRRTVIGNARFQPPGSPAQEGSWNWTDGWVRNFPASGYGLGVKSNQDFTAFRGSRPGDMTEQPDFFAAELRKPEAMGYNELRTYISELKVSGQAVPDLEVDLQNKLAFPAVCFVMALVALPFAFRLGRQGTLYGIGLSIILAMVFFAVMAVFSALGKAEVLPALVAVWSPSVLFGSLAAYLFLGIRT